MYGDNFEPTSVAEEGQVVKLPVKKVEEPELTDEEKKELKRRWIRQDM